MSIKETAAGQNSVAVAGEATGSSSVGVAGKGESSGVRGDGKNWHGVEGYSESTIGGFGVYGESLSGGSGVVGKSKGWHAVAGFSESTIGGHGVLGDATGTGVAGISKTWLGVYGETNAPASVGACGVLGEGKDGGDGVKGHARAPGKAGVAGHSLNNNGPGVFGKGSPAGQFEGNVVITGDVSAHNLHCANNIKCVGDVFLANADCAEEFDVATLQKVDPGTVMVLGDDGLLHPSCKEYDRRVAGIISGAGTYRPALILDKQRTGGDRMPVALMGKVYCKVDASLAPIEIGDLLTTAPTPGHAMKATDSSQAFGAVVGKALRPLATGRGLIPVLVTLQ